MFDHEKSAHRTTVFPVGLLDREPGPELAAFLSKRYESALEERRLAREPTLDEPPISS